MRFDAEVKQSTNVKAKNIMSAAGYQPNITFVAEDIVFTVHSDGTFIKEVTERIRIDTDRGGQENGQMSLRYSESLEGLSIESAYTTTQDGRRIDVTADRIIEQQSAGASQAPMFDDNKVKVVVFPSVEIGATLTLQHKRIQKTALFPGHFFALEYFGVETPRESANLTIHAPASMQLHVDAIDVDGGRVESTQPEWQTWSWSLANRPARPPEMESVNEVDHSPRVAVSTFVDYAAVAAAYEARAVAQAAVSPAIQALADQLTQGTTDPRQQAEILYNWVSTNIRYVAIHLGVGGVVPHDADAVREAGYGDCKDHVALLEALLAAKGIKSAAALVNGNNLYWFPKAAIPLGVINHAVTYLPGFNLLVDSTAGLARFGALPASLLGKSALVTDDGHGHARVITVPLAHPDTDRVTVATQLTINNQGDVLGSSRIDNAGAFDLASRQIFHSIRPGFETQVAARVLAMSGQDGTGAYSYGDVRDLAQPFHYETRFTLLDYALFPGPAAIQVPLGLSSFSHIGTMFELAASETRAFAMPMASRQVTETTIITFPAGISIPVLPKPADIRSRWGIYTSTYQADNQTITVTRKLEFNLEAALIQPGDYPEFRKMALAIKRNLRTQLVYY